jgi:predicted MFS family arabinose efflux permease
MATTTRHPGAVVAVLGTAQTLSWASSYYLVAMLATPISLDLGIEAPTVFLGFSIALLVSAATGPWAGRAIDRSGGRTVLMVTNLQFALALAMLALASDAATMFAAWALMGVAIGAGLYEAAFATLVRLYGRESRNAITGITLIAGFASTVGWPLTAWMEAQWGWRGACWGWVVLHLAVGVPLNAWLPRSGSAAPDRPIGAAAASASAESPSVRPSRATGALLALVFATGWFVSTSMAAHLPRVVQAAGAGLATAVLVGALVGPSQVAGRLLEFGFLRRLHPLLAARAATLTHPAAVAVLLIGGPALAPAFGILHGLGNGIMTIAMATLPLALFGPEGYGARQGWLMVPARVLQAFAPFLFGLALDRWGAGALAFSAAASGIGFVALLALSARGATGRDAIGR